MNKNTMTVKEFKEMVEPTIFYSWVNAGIKREWLNIDPADERNIILSKRFSENNFGLSLTKDGHTILGMKKNNQLSFMQNAKSIFFKEIDGQPKIGVFLSMNACGIEKPYFIFIDAIKDVEELIEMSDIVLLVPFSASPEDVKFGKVWAKLNVVKGER